MNSNDITQELENIKRSGLQGEKLRHRLASFIRQLSIDAKGNTTVLYAGRIDNSNTSISTAKITAKAMAKDNNIRVLMKLPLHKYWMIMNLNI